MNDLSDEELIALYRLYSEEFWAAGFMSPDPDVVERFREWLAGLKSVTTPRERYEQEMLDEFHRQEQELRNG